MAKIEIPDHYIEAIERDAHDRGLSVEFNIELIVKMHLREMAKGEYAKDQLTGCFTRHQLYQYINTATWGASWDDGSIYRQRFLCIDIDNFKKYLDYSGLMAGDSVLKSIGTNLMKSYGNEVVYRWGGDEFVVILEKNRLQLPDIKEITLKHSVVEVKVQRNQKRNHHLSHWIQHHIDAGMLAAKADGNIVHCNTPVWMQKKGGKIE